MSIKAQAFTGGNLFINGSGLLGEVSNVELPKIERDTIEASSGIGKGEVVLPTLKALTTKITVNNLNKLYFDALDTSKTQEFYIKANATNAEGEDTQMVATFKGKFKNLDGLKFEFSKEIELSMEASLTYYKLEVGGETALLVDLDNNVCSVGGTDIFETIRKNIL